MNILFPYIIHSINPNNPILGIIKSLIQQSSISPIYNTRYISLPSYCLYHQTNKTTYVSFTIRHLYSNSSAIYSLRTSYPEHHKYILITISYYNPSYETLSTSSIIHLFSFTYHTVILSYFDTLITVIFHTFKLITESHPNTVTLLPHCQTVILLHFDIFFL